MGTDMKSGDRVIFGWPWVSERTFKGILVAETNTKYIVQNEAGEDRIIEKNGKDYIQKEK